MSQPTWRGELRRGEAQGTITGFLEDIWHWRIHITGTRQDDGSYALTAEVGEVPEALKLPLVDDRK